MLGARSQKLLKCVHETCAAVLAGSAVGAWALAGRAGADPAVYRLFTDVQGPALVGCAATGLGFALFTRWGFFRFRWLIVKWAALALLVGIGLVRIAPAVHGMAALSSGAWGPADPEHAVWTREAWRWGALACALLVGMIFLSVLKPWGPVRRTLHVRRRVQLGLAAALVLLAVSGATLQFSAVRRLRALQVGISDLAACADGSRRGTYTAAGFTYEVEVEVRDHAIARVEIVRNRSGPYARFAERIVPRVLATQSAGVDAVTGATTTSKCLMKAVEAALGTSQSAE